MKKILGLDLGSNSIGWAVINLDFENEQGEILGAGSRIIPMDADLLLNFEQGNTISKTAARRQARGARRLRHRYKLRRSRLIEVLKIIGWLPEDFQAGHKLPVSQSSVSEMQAMFGATKIPEDWVIYFLRHKALNEKISLPELARILYHMNQRRGFKSNRKANNEVTSAIEASDGEPSRRESRVEIVRVIGIRDTGETVRRKKAIELEVSRPIVKDIRKGIIYRDNLPEWENQDIELEVRIIPSKNETRVEFAIPDKTDWQKLREALSKNLDQKQRHPGSYFLQEILNDRNYRIRERIIDRNRYEAELKEIWQKQSEFHPELLSKDLLRPIAEKLYPKNQVKQQELLANDLLFLLSKDIIYYQRPLKSQKSGISECRFEKKNVTLTRVRNGKTYNYSPGYKVAPASSPVFQEFRIWKTLHNIKVFNRKQFINGQWETDIDETDTYVRPNLDVLFDYFDGKEKIKVTDIFKILGVSDATHRLNYPPDTEFPGNETKHFFRKAFKKFDYTAAGDQLLSDKEQFRLLWHLLYSVDDESAIKNALQKRFHFPEELARYLSLQPPFKLRYAAYSTMAMNKLLPLMRSGKYWSEENIPAVTRERIEKLNDGILDESLSMNMRERLEKFRMEHGLTSISDYQALPEWLACYITYGKHSEKGTNERCSSPEEIKGLEARSLRNPIVEQVINETLQLVKDVWARYGWPEEIRVELARDLKKTAKERKIAYDLNRQNKDDKDRIKAILRELSIGNPDSISDIEKVRILEENGNYKYHNLKDRFFKKVTEPTRSEIEKYKLWVEQHCISPYTGKTIMLSELFTPKYEVEHIIPRALYYDDSLSNKVIVESWANKEKDKATAMQYIQKGSLQEKLLEPDAYIAHIEKTFNGKKRRNLLATEIPKGFIERQLNDTRYIGRKIQELLEQVTDKVWVTSGRITDELKHKWGLNDQMKSVLEGRFRRLEGITGETLVQQTTDENGRKMTHLLGYDKRIDNRHHALDAIVVACTTHSHIQYINTLEAQSKDSNLKYTYRKKLLQSDKTRDFRKPWKTFVEDARNALENIIISYKNRHRILSKGMNKYIKYVQNENGEWLKRIVLQSKGPLFSVRKPLHKETISGVITMRERKTVKLEEALNNVSQVADRSVRMRLKALLEHHGADIKKIKLDIKSNPLIDSTGNPIEKIPIWFPQKYAINRVSLDATFTKEKIDKIAEYNSTNGKGLKHYLFNHLQDFGHDSKAAFTGEGLYTLSQKIGRPVTKVSIYEPIGNKFEIREGQMVEAAKGTNLFFVIYEDLATGSRSYTTLGLREVITAKMNNWPLVPPKDGYRYQVLSPNDLVYVPEETENIKSIDWTDKKSISHKIYKMVSASGNQCFFIPHHIAKPIIDTKELGANNKSERSWDGQMIKQCCIKLKIDRLGNLTPA